MLAPTSVTPPVTAALAHAMSDRYKSDVSNRKSCCVLVVCIHDRCPGVCVILQMKTKWLHWCLSDRTWKEQCKLGWFQVSWSLSTEHCGNVSEPASAWWRAHGGLRNHFVIDFARCWSLLINLDCCVFDLYLCRRVTLAARISGPTASWCALTSRQREIPVQIICFTCWVDEKEAPVCVLPGSHSMIWPSPWSDLLENVFPCREHGSAPSVPSAGALLWILDSKVCNTLQSTACARCTVVPATARGRCKTRRVYLPLSRVALIWQMFLTFWPIINSWKVCLDAGCSSASSEPFLSTLRLISFYLMGVVTRVLYFYQGTEILLTPELAGSRSFPWLRFHASVSNKFCL